MQLKHFLLSALLLPAALFTQAQTPDTARLVVHYQFTHIRDTTDKEHPYTENMMLLAGNRASVYKSYDRIKRMAQVQADVSNQINNSAGSAGGPQNFTIRSSGPVGSRAEYFYFFPERKSYRREQLINNYILDQPFETPQWKISTDTLTIGGLHCQKATTRFKGRDYLAWFCADLPFHTGPWKLVGLPGLVVQAASTKGDVVFKFDGIEEASKLVASQPKPPAAPGGQTRMIMIGGLDDKQPADVIALPENGLKVTEKDFTRLMEMRDKDPQGFLQAQMAGAGITPPSGGGQMSFKIQTPPAGIKKPVINNPLELPNGK